MKIRERLTQTGGMGGGTVTMERVREVPKDTPLPAGAEQVDEKTPASGWEVVEG